MGRRRDDELALRRCPVGQAPQTGWVDMEGLSDHDRIITNWYVDVLPGHSAWARPGVVLTADFWRSAA